MKKTILFLAVVAMFSATSCKKEYTCSCSIAGGTPVEVKSGKKLSKKDAKTWCTNSNTVAGVSCSLK
jgi:hypothetical protein